MRKYLFFVMAVLLLASCNKNSLQYMPFQSDKDGDWGMISPDGKVLFDDEFKEEPTVALHDRFFAKNNDGKWELYSTDEKPQQIGSKEYDEAGAFIENVAPVVAKGKRIQFIDKTGEVKFELDKAGGKPVLDCTNFSDGVAIIHTSEGYGCIDTEGKVIVEPRYAQIWPAGDGKIVAIKNKYKDSEREDAKVTVLSTKGEELSEFSMKKFSNIYGTYQDGVMIVAESRSDDEIHCGLIDQNGDYVVSPSSKVNAISDVRGDKFIYTNDDEFGLMNTKGEVIIRAKYKVLAFSGKDGLYFAAKGDDMELGLINEKDENVTKFDYDNAIKFRGSLAPVKDGDNSWIFINDKGEEQKLKTDISNIDDSSVGDEIFHSQHGDAVESDTSDIADTDSIAADSAVADTAAYGSYDNSYSSQSQSIILGGTVGKYPITMQLDINGSNVSGWYYYNKYQNKIPFTGSVYDGGTIELDCDGGDNFIGDLTDSGFSGMFTSNTGAKYDFELTR